jgi:hypothetical protein
MALFQMNVGPTLPAIRRLNRLRLPLKVVTVGTSNFDPRFSSHLELLTGAGKLHTTSGASQQILQRKGLRLEEWTASFFRRPREGICLYRAVPNHAPKGGRCNLSCSSNASKPCPSIAFQPVGIS